MAETCEACHGSKECENCNGKGYLPNGDPCNNCRFHDGKCISCGGNGVRVYIVM